MDLEAGPDPSKLEGELAAAKARLELLEAALKLSTAARSPDCIRFYLGACFISIYYIYTQCGI